MRKFWLGVLLCVAFISTASAQEHWGTFKRDGCTGPGLRQYSAILWGVPWGQSWEDACARMPARINGQRFAHPTRCVTNINEWGEFDVQDSGCGRVCKGVPCGSCGCCEGVCRNQQCCVRTSSDQMNCAVCR